MVDAPAFRKALLSWYERQKRDLPWRQTKDPYRIWISEIMLQQTRVATVIPYYERFLQRFPNVQALAEAPEEDLLHYWAGLGYYTRARNLQKAAREIAAQGAFPSSYEAIRALPGIGDYTAAAVASIAFDIPAAVLDGNVMRVLTRLDNDSADIQSTKTRARLQARAQELLHPRKPGSFNQAVMELGATICLPKNPQCLLCPVQAHCEGLRAGAAAHLPVKGRRPETRRESRTLLLVRHDGRILAKLRSGFWELPQPEDLPDAEWRSHFGAFQHAIMNTVYRFELVAAAVHGPPTEPLVWIDTSHEPGRSLSTVTRKALRLATRQAPAP